MANFQRGRGAYCLHPKSSGLLLNGFYREQCLFILIGSGANGKSTFLRVLQHLLGDYAGTIPMLGLMEQKYGSQTNDLAHLFGKRLAVASDGWRPLVPLT